MSDSQKLKSRLEVATNVAVLLAGATLLFTFAWNFYRARHLTPPLQPGLQKSVMLGATRGIDYGASPRTLLVAMSTRCGHCAAGAHFYNRLAELQGVGGGAVHVVSVFPEGEEEVSRYASRVQLRLDAIAAADFAALNLTGTPTLILVDSSGKVLDFWVGPLSPGAEQEVIQRLGG